MNAGVTLHIETLYGANSHHIAESCFKGVARALGAALAIDATAGRPGALHEGRALTHRFDSWRSMRFILPRSSAIRRRRSTERRFSGSVSQLGRFVFAPLWLLVKRLWLALGAWILGAGDRRVRDRVRPAAAGGRVRPLSLSPLCSSGSKAARLQGWALGPARSAARRYRRPPPIPKRAEREFLARALAEPARGAASAGAGASPSAARNHRPLPGAGR